MSGHGPEHWNAQNGDFEPPDGADGYLIQFDFPEGTVWAGDAGDQMGLAPQVETAHVFPEQDLAVRFLANYWGPATRRHGSVVPAPPEAGREPPGNLATREEVD